MYDDFTSGSSGVRRNLGLVTLLQVHAVAVAADGIKRTPCVMPPAQNAMRAEEDVREGYEGYWRY